MPRSRQTKRAVPSPQPNHLSIATMISVGPASVLLGADVENSGTPTAGWEAILGTHHQSPLTAGASVYKIPHHGSQNAHNPEVWRQLLKPKPMAALTPWRKGRGRLPTREGIAEIVSRTPFAFATAVDARTPRQRRARPASVLRSVRENRRVKLRSLEVPFGAVRFRSVDLSAGTWQHELFGAACHLRQYRRAAEVRETARQATRTSLGGLSRRMMSRLSNL
jgi:hypothetical protein